MRVHVLKTAAVLAVLLAANSELFGKPRRGATPVGTVIRGRASYHLHTNRFVTAAHGVRRGAKLWVWNPAKGPRSGCAVWVNDAGPYRKGRVLDLSTGAFSYLYGGLKRGHAPVAYKVLRDGKGAWTGRLRR